ncbi:pyocin knob domain-containing protein [Enterobacter roggenkampii]|uniref:pyocin knob domain-containing protein n=1 Tax=Enterobacter roggenkampii TaxID=1812935 RepID=UPI0020044F8B|nr:pyocin knob domain-containing protein [Enterobacter roggenkampii]MCK7252850.1 hypothetical protein [Enterobacter roggenkampii]
MSAGTITITNGSAIVGGADTSFSTELESGDFIVTTVGGVSYTLPIMTVDSDTQLTLISNFTGPTQAGAAWSAVPRVALNMVTAGLVAQSAEALRGLNYDKQNWQQVFSESGYITVRLPDGSTYPGPSWPYIAKIAENADFDRLKILTDQINESAAQIEKDVAGSKLNADSAYQSAQDAKDYAKSSSDDAGESKRYAENAAKSAANAKQSEDNSALMVERSRDEANRAKTEADRAEVAADRAEAGLPAADVIWEHLGVSKNARKALTKNQLEAADFNAAPAPKKGQVNLNTLFAPGTYYPSTFGTVSNGYPENFMYASVRVVDAGYNTIIQIIENADGAVYTREGKTDDDGKTYSFSDWTGGHSSPVDANQKYRVGSIVMAAIVNNGGASLQYEQTISGAGLRASSVSLPFWSRGNGVIYSGATLSGTWRHLGHANSSGADDNPVGGNSYPVSLFIRIL